MGILVTHTSCPRSFKVKHIYKYLKVQNWFNHLGQGLNVLTACSNARHAVGWLHTQKFSMTKRASLLMYNDAQWTSLEPRKLFCHLLVNEGPRFRLVALLVPSCMLRLSLKENSLSFDSVHLPAFLPESLNLMIGGYQDSKACWPGISLK